MILGLAVCAVQALAEDGWQPRWDLFWKGSALFAKGTDRGGLLSNRLDLRLEPLAGLAGWEGLRLRAEALDRRNLPQDAESMDAFKTGALGAAGGLYYKPWGSRLLFGPLEEYGLGARIRNVWQKAAPFAENHAPSLRDMRTEPTASVKNEGYLYAGTPVFALSDYHARLPDLEGFAYASLDMDTLAGAYGAGLRTRWTDTITVNAEGFYTGWKLPPRQATAWFSEKPPLPERDFDLLACSLSAAAPWGSLAADAAFSEAFAFGRGVYVNAGLSANLAAWRVSLAADAATSRYVGRDGAAPGAGGRLAVKAERRGKRSSLFRVSGTLRGAAWDAKPNQSSASLYWRFQAQSAKKLPLSAAAAWIPHPSRVTLSADRDARDLNAILDSYDALAAFNIGPFGTALSAGLTLKSRADHLPQPFPVPLFSGGDSGLVGMSSAKLAAELYAYPGPFQVKTKAACTLAPEKSPLWTASLYGAFRKRPFRVSVNLSADKLPSTEAKDFSCTVSCSWEK